MRQTTKKLLITATTALLFTACEDSNSAIPSASDQLTITAANQSAVSALVFDSIDGSTPPMPSSAMTASSSSVSQLLPNYTAIQAPPTTNAYFS